MDTEINVKNKGNSYPKHRVLFIITQLEMGGAQRFLHNFLSHASGQYQVMVATGSDGGIKLTDKLKLISVETETLKFLKREVSPHNDIKACFEIRNLIDKFQPDTLFLLSSKAGFIGSLATYYLLRTTRPRVIYRIGGWTFNDPWPAWKKKLWVKLERISAKWKDVIIVNNKHDFEQAEKLGIKPKEKLVLIHNGIDPYKLDFLPRDEARLFKGVRTISFFNFKGPDPLIIVGTIANLYPAKGIKFLIETAEYFKNNEGIIFIVIGDGPEYHNLKLKIESLKLDKKIFLLGQIKDGHRYMPAFDIFVLPSVKEGFPWVLIEAMSAKLPVIATRVGAVPEIIENGKNGFIVEPGNPASLAGKIKELLANDHTRQEFAIQGHQTVLFKFSEDKMIKEIEALF